MGYRKQRFLKTANSKKNRVKSKRNFKKESQEDEYLRTKVNKKEILESVKLAEIEEMEAEYI